MSDLVTLEIDGVEVKAKPGSMIIEAATQAGIHIPRFCYHKKLSVAANCRMCMVEVEKAPKPLPACATPVGEGMKVFTGSEVARDAQKGTMEFLLINHPLDCPICDQGGECELQDVALTYGSDVSRFTEAKRTVPDPNLGPLVATDMNRCIHCTRCVRFGAEIAGMRELGATGRGEFMKIGTFVEKSVDSELSGNIVDICPVGALTAKPSRFKFRPWELVARHSVAMHDSVGSNIICHLNKGEIVRVVPDENDAINECWLSDRDRFSYEGLYSADRATMPMIKMRGEWREVGWEVALDEVVKRMKAAEPGQSAGLISPNVTLEEMFLAQQWLRGLGVGSIDHRLQCSDFRGQDAAPSYPGLGLPIEALENRRAILLVGSNVRKEQPMIGLRLRKAAANGASLMSINPRDYDFYFDQRESVIVPPLAMPATLAAVAYNLLDARGVDIPSVVNDNLDADSKDDPAIRAMAETLQHEASLLLLGPQAIDHPDAAVIHAVAGVMAAQGNVQLGYLPAGANTAGAWLSGVLPHRGAGGQPVDVPGRTARAVIEQPAKNWFLYSVEPEFDSRDPQRMMETLAAADLVVAMTPYASESLRQVADIILPIATPFETPGSAINLEGRLQSFEAAAHPPGQAKHGWAVLRMLGTVAGLDGFDQNSVGEVLEAVRATIGDIDPSPGGYAMVAAVTCEQTDVDGLFRYSEPGIYDSDAVVRRASSLQATADARDVLRMSAEDADKYNVADGDRIKIMQQGAGTEMTVEIDPSLRPGVVCLQSGYPAHSQLGAASGPVELARV